MRLVALGSRLVNRLLPRLLSRSDYGLVWNWVGRSLTAARWSVAGTADLAEIERTGLSSADTIARETGIGPTDVVLEIGCGIGRVGRHLAPRCGRWIGADVSPRMLSHARRAMAGISNVSFQPLTGYNLTGIDDASVDVVYCTAVFMHLDEWDRYAYVLDSGRVLRPGGRLYIDNFNLLGEEGWQLFLENSRYDPAARPPNISKASTPEELRTYVERAGFTDVRVLAGPLWLTVVARKPAAAPISEAHQSR